jgi:hypothetical protein
MKKVFFVAFCIAGFLVYGNGLPGQSENEASKVILENDKVKVTEFFSLPGDDACGIGKHSHNERLVIAITDASIKLTTEDGTSQDLDLKAGTAFWGGTETHMVINTGKQPAKFYAVEVKVDK